jgi:hypothetical protein
MLDQTHKHHPSIEQRRAERELFFWTAFRALRLVLAAALVGYVIARLVTGELPGGDLLLHSLGRG